MNDKLLDKIELILNEGTILGLKKECITTVSTGVPGEGPIADVQNGIQWTWDKDARKKNRKKRNSLLRRQPIDESIKIDLDEIIDSLGGLKQFKKFKDFSAAWNYVEKNIKEIADILDVKLKEIPMNRLKKKIEKIF